MKDGFIEEIKDALEKWGEINPYHTFDDRCRFVVGYLQTMQQMSECAQNPHPTP